MEFAVLLGIIGTMSVAELGVAAVVNVAIQGFEESVGESRASVVVLEKTLEGFTEEDVFYGNLAGGAAVAYRCVADSGFILQELQVTDWDGSICGKLCP